jgi:hypothetical protein
MLIWVIKTEMAQKTYGCSGHDDQDTSRDLEMISLLLFNEFQH